VQTCKREVDKHNEEDFYNLKCLQPHGGPEISASNLLRLKG
jgi:hypothetical protein